MSAAILSTLRISMAWLFASRTLTRASSQRSPSITSLPPRPSMMSLPAPPRRMLPLANDVTPLPSSACRPSIRAMPAASRTLPCAPARAKSAKTVSVPRNTSAKAEPEKPFHEREQIEERGGRGRSRRRFVDLEHHVDRDAGRRELVVRPVEPRGAAHLLLAVGAEDDVVAAFSRDVFEPRPAHEDVVALREIASGGIGRIAERSVLMAELEPVIAGAADRAQIERCAEHEIVPRARECRRDVFTGDDEVLARRRRKGGSGHCRPG